MFSGAVKIEDINDFINPSQECIVPILTAAKNEGKSDKLDSGKVGLHRSSLRPDLIRIRSRRVKEKTQQKCTTTELPLEQKAEVESLPSSSQASAESPPTKDNAPLPHHGTAEHVNVAAQVSLSDCLACSGCVTTAETVLLRDQSIDVFIEKSRASRFSVVSIAPQSIEFLATHFRLPAHQCFKRLSWVLKFYFKVDSVLDTSVADAFIQTETLREFVERYRVSMERTSSYGKNLDDMQQDSNVNGFFGPESVCSDSKLSGGKQFHESETQAPSTPTDGMSLTQQLPLLTSHCPGWICYVEKTQPLSVISLVSRLKSSQQILGHLVKTLMVDAFNIKQYAYQYRRSTPLPLHPLSPPFSNLIMENRRPTSKTNNIPRPATLSSSSISSSGSLQQESQLLFSEKMKPPVCDQTGGLRPSDVFHAAIMPCFDKKLETVRQENRMSVRETYLCPFHSEREPTRSESSPTSSKERKVSSNDRLRYLDGDVKEKHYPSKGPNNDPINGNTQSDSLTDIQEVDTVLATTEVFTLLERVGIEDLSEVETDDCYNDVMMNTSNWVIWNHYLPGLPMHPTSALRPILLGSSLGENQSQNQSSCRVEAHETHQALQIQHPDHSSRFVHPSSMCLCCHSIKSVEHNNASGGFLEYCFRQGARILFGVVLPDEQALQMKVAGNRDMREVCLKVGDDVKLRFLLAYGFRNIQNVVKLLGGGGSVKSTRVKIEAGKENGKNYSGKHNTIRAGEHGNPVDDKSDILRVTDSNSDVSPDMTQTRIDFVEVMACPRGCKYGGGQVAPKPSERVFAPSNPSQDPLPSCREAITKQTGDERLRNATDPQLTIQSIVDCDSVVIPPHEHPLLPYVYRYLIYLQSLHCVGSQESHLTSSSRSDPYLGSTFGHYRCLSELHEQLGLKEVSNLQW